MLPEDLEVLMEQLREKIRQIETDVQNEKEYTEMMRAFRARSVEALSARCVCVCVCGLLLEYAFAGGWTCQPAHT